MRATRGQRVQAVLGAPGHVAAQVGLGVVTGGAFETGQAGSHRQPQLISERHQVIGRDRGQVGEVPHGQTLRLLRSAAKPAAPARQLRTFTHSAAGNYALSRALTCTVAENRAGRPTTTFPAPW
jgi:hypothetical protein